MVLRLTHADPCSAHFFMSPLFVTPDSDHQLVRRELHELNLVLRCIKALSSSKNFIPTPNIELYYVQCETLYPAASPLRATTLPSAKLASVSSTGTGFSKVDVILYQFSSRWCILPCLKNLRHLKILKSLRVFLGTEYLSEFLGNTCNKYLVIIYRWITAILTRGYLSLCSYRLASVSSVKPALTNRLQNWIL